MADIAEGFFLLRHAEPHPRSPVAATAATRTDGRALLHSLYSYRMQSRRRRCNRRTLQMYEEVAQVDKAYCDLFDLGPYPNIQRWMVGMRKLPKYDEAHEGLRQVSKVLKSKLAESKAKL